MVILRSTSYLSPLERHANPETKSVETDIGPGCCMLLVSRTRPDFKSSAFLDGISMAALKVENLLVMSRMHCLSHCIISA